MPLITQFSYALHLAADLHIGSGVGLPGVVDEHIVRDHQSYAFAPFSGIKGIVRDSCVQLLKYLDCYADTRYICSGHRQMLEDPPASPQGFCGRAAGDKLCALCAIFGAPMAESHWWFSPASYTHEYRNAIEFGAKLGVNEGSSRLLARRDAAFSAHAAIDPLTRRAAEKQLFNLEVMRQPDVDAAFGKIAVWTGDVIYRRPLAAALSNKSTERSDDELLGWLLAALLFTRRIGGRRRRGWGRCRFVITDVSGRAPQSEPDKQKLALNAREKVEAALKSWLDVLQNDGKVLPGGV